MSDEPRKPTYWCDCDSQGEPIGNLGFDLDHAVRCIADDVKAFLEDAEDGESKTFIVGRTDMTQAEADRMPEL